MNDSPTPPTDRFGWLAFPLLVCAASRALIAAFAKSALLFGPKMGSDPGLPRSFLDGYPTWAALGHGEIADVARVARVGYQVAADAVVFPVVPLLGKALGRAGGSLELGLVVLSLVACAAGFCGMYRLFADLRGPDAARWGVALLAAFPFSYHLSDGGPLAAGLALSTWGVALAVRGSLVWSGALLSLAALAHPVGIFSTVAAALAPRMSGACGAWRKWAAAAVPLLALAIWLVVLRARLGASSMALWRALVPKTAPSSQVWLAMVLAFGGVVVVGLLLLARDARLRLLSLVGVLQVGLAMLAWTTSLVFALTLCWPAFLGLAALLGERTPLRAPLVAMLGAHQGLLLYCFTHFLRFT